MRMSGPRSSLGWECCPPLRQAFKPVRLDRAQAVGQCITAGRQDCKTLKTTLIHQHAAMHMVSLGLTAGALLFPAFAVADTVMTQPSKTEVPAAVNTVVTEENAAVQRETKNPSEKVALHITIDGQKAGKIVIQPFRDAPLGSQRFLDLAKRKAGGYRLSKVDGISDAFITVSGVLQLNYNGLPELTGGETVEELEAEQTLSKHSHDKGGLVSLIVKAATPDDIREKLVAYQGKFIKVQEVRGASSANGTGFAITLRPAPVLDTTNLIIGEVVGGEDVVEKIARLPKVKNASWSPFFKVAKALGDRRADTAAKSFGKPLGRVVVDSVSVSGE